MIEGTGTLTWTAEGEEITPAWSTAYAAINALQETGIPMGVRIEVQIGRKVVSSAPAILPPAHLNGNSVVSLDPTPAALGEVRRAARPGGKKGRPAAETPGPELDAVVLGAQVNAGEVRWTKLTLEQKRTLAGHFLSGLALEIGEAPTQARYDMDRPAWLPLGGSLPNLFAMSWSELSNYAAAGQL